MTTATTTPTTDAVLADIERRLAELGAPGDVLNTDNAQNAYHAKRSALWNWRRAITTSTATLAQVEPRIAADEEWLDHLTKWRDALAAELDAGPPRIRNERELAVQQNLKTSIRIIDFGKRCDGEWTRDIETLRLGDLMRAPGYVVDPPPPNTNAVGTMPFYGSLSDVRGRLKDLRARQQEAQMLLDDAMRDATS